MVFFGVEFEETREDINKYVSLIRANAESKSAMMLFDVKVYVLEPFKIAIHKEFIPFKNMLWGLFFLSLGSLIPLIFWQVSLPFVIVLSIVLGLLFVETPMFNFFLFKLMLKKNGYIGRVRLL